MVSALDLEPELRGSYLDRACGADAGLRAEAGRLVEAHPRAAGFLERPPWELLEQALEDGAAGRGPAAAPASPAPGARIGRYVVLREIGAGGMGAVYAARDPELDREVAVKLIPPGGGAPERLLREARTLARVSHPNVVTVHDAGRHGDGVFLAMELVPGGTLEEWLEAAPRGRREVLDAFLQAARGLAAAHHAGVVHRDFKPGNVLRGTGGELRVADFGLARAGAGAAGDPEAAGEPGPSGGAWPVALLGAERRSTAAAMGTPSYMAPEQHRGEAVGPWTDQFAFAVALWAALAGEHPFEGGSPAATRANAVAGELRSAPPSTRLPRRLRAALARGLARQPAERWGSMAELIAALERGRRSRGRAAAAGAALAALAVAAAAILPGRGAVPPPDRSPGATPGVPAARPTASVEAWGFYLKGREQWNRRTPEGLLQAIALFEHSVAEDPGFVLAHAGLADAWALLTIYAPGADSGALERARAAAERALALDPGLAAAHASLGSVLVREGELERAEAELRRAVALDPDYAPARHWLGHLLVRRLGRLREGVAELEAARRLDPASSAVLAMLAGGYYRAGRHGEALAAELALRDLDPEWDGGGDCITRNYISLGRYAEAAAAVASTPPEERTLSCWQGLAEAHHLAGDYAAELAAARTGRQFHPDAPELLVAETAALAGLGRPGEAAALTAAALEEGPEAPAWYWLDDMLGELRAHGHRERARSLAAAITARHGARPASSPPPPALTVGLAAALIESGRAAEGAALLTSWLEPMDPAQRRTLGLGEYDAVGVLGWLAALRGDRRAAAAALERLAALEAPADADPWPVLIRAALGEREAAAADLRRRLAGGLVAGRDLHAHVGLEALRAGV